MNLMDFCMWGFPQIQSFSGLVYFLTGTYFELIFLVWVLNMAMSVLKRILYHFGGVKNGC